MKNKIYLAAFILAAMSIAIGCKNKKPDTNANTVETAPLPPVVNTPTDNIESIVNVDSIVKSKSNTPDKGLKADKNKPKVVEPKPATNDKAKDIAAVKPKPTTLPKTPVKAVPPKAKPTATSDKFPDENVVKRNGRDDVLKVAEGAPAYNGGEAAMRKFLQKNIKYPSKAKEDGVQGTVFVRFVVEKDGLVDDVAVAKGVHPMLDAEAKRVVSVMPKWTPGKQNGKLVAVQYTLPVRFQLVD